MKFILRIFFTWLAVLISCAVLPGVTVRNNITALLVAAVWSLLNALIKPLIVLLTLPLTVLTLGIFLLFINAGIALIDAYFVHGFVIDDFGWALLFSILVSIITGILFSIDKNLKKKQVS